RYKRRDGNACAASSLLAIYSLDRLVPRIAVKFPPAPGRTVGKFALLSRSTGCTMATAKSSDATPKANRNGRSLLGLSGSSSSVPRRPYDAVASASLGRRSRVLDT